MPCPRHGGASRAYARSLNGHQQWPPTPSVGATLVPRGSLLPIPTASTNGEGPHDEHVGAFMLVGLLTTYARSLSHLDRRPAKAALLKRWESRTDQQPTRRPYKLAHRDMDETRQAVVEGYLSGLSCDALRLEYGLGKSSVISILSDAGIERRHQRMRGDDLARAIDLYKSGLSLAEVGAVLGRSASTIQSALQRSQDLLRSKRG